jgi:hypothetical protein
MTDGAMASARVKIHSNTNNNRLGSCAQDTAFDPSSRKCVATKAVNYNASKSNTGNLTVQGSKGQSSNPGPRPTTSAKYHCSHGEYMLSNGDCVPNPQSNPN